MQVKLHIYYQTQDGLNYKKTLSYINPEVSEENLMNFVAALNQLSTDKLGSVYKVVNDFLSNVKPGDEEITTDDIIEIIGGDYIMVPDNDGVTVEEINAILGGDFVPIDDPDGITQEDIDNIFS